MMGWPLASTSGNAHFRPAKLVRATFDHDPEAIGFACVVIRSKTISFFGRNVSESASTADIALTVSSPCITRPKIVQVPFRCGQGAEVKKNWLPTPVALGSPAFAKATTPDAEKLRSATISSATRRPHTLRLRRPVPVGSPPCTACPGTTRWNSVLSYTCDAQRARKFSQARGTRAQSSSSFTSPIDVCNVTLIARCDSEKRICGLADDVERRSIVQTQALTTQNRLASAYFPYWFSDDDDAVLFFLSADPRRENAHRTMRSGVGQKDVSNEKHKPQNFATEKYVQNASEYAWV
jgi:hypothetical protein